jgi:hypothetical protein
VLVWVRDIDHQLTVLQTYQQARLAAEAIGSADMALKVKVRWQVEAKGLRLSPRVWWLGLGCCLGMATSCSSPGAVVRAGGTMEGEQFGVAPLRAGVDGWRYAGPVAAS